ncbi:hypothetical protein OMR07_02140 [Methylobacterium organophilum]|nr:hypothetical protein [Methylobacterium organophilum]
MIDQPITRDSLRGSPSTMILHAKLARGGVMFEWRCDRRPRLVKHYYRGTRTSPAQVTWSVDGHRCADLDEAIRFLNGPVIAEDLYEVAADHAGAAA